MKFNQFFQFTGVITLAAVIYISMQMQIVDLAYQNDKEEKQIRHLIEDNGNIAYAIFSLKSANNLGGKMLTDRSDMTFLDPSHIVQVSSLESPAEMPTGDKISKFKKSIEPLLSLLSLNTQAEAQTRE